MKFSLDAVKTVVTSKAGRSILKLRKASPTILFAAGVVGVVGTVVLASRATLKLDDTLDEFYQDSGRANAARQYSPEEYSEESYRRDMLIVYARAAKQVGTLYAPAVICGVLSVACLTGSHFILSSRNVALTAAYAAVDKAYRAYQQRVVDEYGEETHRKFLTELRTDATLETLADGTTKSSVQEVVAGSRSPYAVVFDQKSPSWSKEMQYNQIFLQCQQNYANDLLRARGHVMLNDVLDMLGLDRTKAGCVVGWVKDSKDGDNYIDFGVFRGDTHMGQQFVNGDERSVWLDFNVDGVIYDKI